MINFVNEISSLSLESLDEGWVQNIYNSEFLECAELPQEYEDALDSANITEILQNLVKHTASLISAIEEISWAKLSESVSREKLLALIFYFIDFGIKNVFTKEYRDNAILAARLYCKCLLIPRFKAYNIYHPQLFTQSLICLNFPKIICESDGGYLNSRLMVQEINSLNRNLKRFVIDVKAVVQVLHLQPNDVNFEEILSNLVDFIGGAITNKPNVDKLELDNILKTTYEIIDHLLLDKNRKPSDGSIHILFKCLLPKLITATSDNRSVNSLLRASYVPYLGVLLSRYGKPALSSFIILLQHLAHSSDGLERAEVRLSRVTLIVGLMSLLPGHSYRTYIKWVLKLSMASKAPQRLTSLEILSKLLYNDPDDEVHKEQATTDNQEGVQATNKQAEEESAKVSNESGELEIDEGCSIEAEESQVRETVTLHARTHTAPHADMLKIVYERANDVSSTVRTKALHMLTECVASDFQAVRNALKVLNGDSERPLLIVLAIKCMSDERAVVRRASVTLVHRLLEHHESLITEINLGVLVSLCRDASILVRSAAISAVGELVKTWPETCTLDAFLTGPIHQLSDPEVKVQEQVVTLVRQLLIERLQKCSPTGLSDPLPWMFLNALTKHNMRRHLQKACTLLSKSSNCINHRLVDILSTHLDGENSLECLVMLTSVARHVDYNEVEFIIDYYYKLSKETEVSDPRILPLVLELLTEWSQWLQGDTRTALRDDLIKSLGDGTFGDDDCRSACAILAAHLDSDNIQWATEMLLIYERRALAGAPIGEWICAADMSLVATEPPSKAFIQLFVNNVVNPPSELDEVSRGCLVAGLGRMCIRSREVALTAAPAFARVLLDQNASMPSRVNSLLALSDICTRYTCIVEPLLGDICGCLDTTSPPALRRAAARALTRLLLGGFLRLRTPLYFRYCALLTDSDHDVREPAEYYVTCCLTIDSIYHHFVECVLYFNGCSSHHDSLMTEETPDAVNNWLTFDSRQLIYDVMLQRMSLVQRLNVQCQLAREILVHAADVCDEGAVGKEPELPSALHSAVLDTITLLCGPRMRLPRKPQTAADLADIDDLTERVTTNIVSHKMKRTVAEVLVPAVLRLYARLRQSGGQLTAYLVRIANDLLKDYRQEIEELIDIDEELVGRIRHFQETIGEEPSFGNTRNLVTTSAPPDPDCTPRMKVAEGRKRGSNVMHTNGSSLKRTLKL